MAGKKINSYGFGEIVGFTQFDYDRLAFLKNQPISAGGLGRFEHFKNIANKFFPNIEWNDWLEKCCRSLCEERWICWSGCAAAGKTYGAALFAVVWWLCDPENSSVILTSTTAKSLRRRAWAEVSKFYSMLPGRKFGNFVDSQTMWQSKKGDDRNAIFGIAVHDGNTQKAVDNIKGVHTKRQLIIIDEATSTPEAIFEAANNLFGYPEEFIMLVIGNPYSRFDPMGRFAEPKDGWMSVSVDDDEWETTVKLDGSNGVCVRFDAERSPNILAGKTVSKHLVTKDKLNSAKAGMGEDNPRYWSEYRGFWPPDGLSKTVFNETLIINKETKGKFTFLGNTFMVAGFDPAFGGGDRPILRFAKCGELTSGKIGIQLLDPIQLKVSAADRENDNHYQLTEQLMNHCQQMNCDPRFVAIDATGEGGGLCNIIGRTWSNDIIRVEFGGRATELPVSVTDRRKSSDVYKNRATELWFSAKEFVLAKQLKGLDPDTIIELCSRFYEDIPGKKMKLEAKDETKKRIGRSPDLADATILCIEAARLRGVAIEGEAIYTNSNDEWQDLAMKANEIYEEESFSYDYVEAE